MVGEERSELLRPVGPGEKDVRNEPRLVVNGDDPGADIVRKRGEIRNRKAADRVHRASVAGTLWAVPIVINFHQPHKVDVLVDGVADVTIVTRMVFDVRQVFRHIVGGWRVTVRASARGQWRMELSGASGRHVWLFAAATAALPAAVVEKLEGFLRESAAAWRPLPVGV